MARKKLRDGAGLPSHGPDDDMNAHRKRDEAVRWFAVTVPVTPARADSECFGWSSGRGSEGVGPSTSRYKATIPKSTRRDPRGRVWEGRSRSAAGTPKTQTLVRARQASKASREIQWASSLDAQFRCPYPCSLPRLFCDTQWPLTGKRGEQRALEVEGTGRLAATSASGCAWLGGRPSHGAASHLNTGKNNVAPDMPLGACRRTSSPELARDSDGRRRRPEMRKSGRSPEERGAARLSPRPLRPRRHRRGGNLLAGDEAPRRL